MVVTGPLLDPVTPAHSRPREAGPLNDPVRLLWPKGRWVGCKCEKRVEAPLAAWVDIVVVVVFCCCCVCILYRLLCCVYFCKTIIVFINRDCVVPALDIVATCEHLPCKTLHYRLSLQMEVTHHGVTLPAAEETNDIGVNLGAKQRHGTSCSQASGIDLTGH